MSGSPSPCQDRAADQLRTAVRVLMPRAWTDLAALVALESVADTAGTHARDCEQTARLAAGLFRAEGLVDTGLHPTPDGSKAVIGRAQAPRGAPTVLLYSHYDVQPTPDTSEWETPPFQLTQSGGRWHGRGVADYQGNIVTQLTALRALGSGNFPVGVVVVAEGSEEQGTGGLEAFVTANPDLVHADAILVCDAGNIAAGTPTVTTTLRGITNVTVHAETLAHPVHSGVFGVLEGHDRASPAGRASIRALDDQLVAHLCFHDISLWPAGI